MARRRVYQTSYPEPPPAWYWERGLHDACIIGVEAYEFPFDYDKFVGEKSKYNRNLLTLKIDAKGAMYDTRVREIRLFNYKILSKDITLQESEKIWWLADRLCESVGHSSLEITLQDFDAYPEEFTFCIQFDRAEVDRA